ncbi:MAG: trigger factor family protein, partial [Chlorobiales bacterium]|nr:trigger factor family protein [Chlorobiales bacterium]
MQKNIRNVSDIEQELEIVLTGEEFKPELEQEFEEARRSVSIKGFRKGHVPASMI